MKIAITGAAGFIGKNLVKALTESGYTLHLLTRDDSLTSKDKNITYFYADLTSTQSNELSSFIDGCEVLIHCAGEIKDEKKMQRLHEFGTNKLVEASRGRIRHWIQLSSCGVYGRPEHGSINELSPKNPIGFYEVTKEISEKMVINAAYDKAFVATILRPSVVYSRDMQNDSLRSLLSTINKGLFFFIGKGSPRLNLIHVFDLASAIEKCILKPPGDVAIYNLSENPSLEEFVNIAAEIMQCPRPNLRLPIIIIKMISYIFGKFPGFPLTPSRVSALTSETVYDSDSAKKSMGWEPKVSLKKGIREIWSSCL